MCQDKLSMYANFVNIVLFINDKYGKLAYCLSTEINGIIQHKRINLKVHSCLLPTTIFNNNAVFSQSIVDVGW